MSVGGMVYVKDNSFRLPGIDQAVHHFTSSFLNPKPGVGDLCKWQVP